MAQPIKICLTCSHGGHLNEMQQLLGAFQGQDCFYFCYDADTTRRLDRAYLVPNMARNPIEFLRNLVRVYRIFRKERPQLIVSTGAEIAIPVVLVMTGKDPATASSIVLTTVTDVVGFFSFLGLATLLSGMLEASP